MRVINNIIHLDLRRDVDEAIVIEAPEGFWGIYDSIQADLKYRKNLNDRAVVSLSGDQLRVEGDDLQINFRSADLRRLRPGRIFMDIKGRAGATVLEPIEFIINLTDTVTKI